MTKKIIVSLVVFTLILAAGGGLLGCGRNPGVSGAASNISISCVAIIPDEISLNPNSHYQFNVSLYDPSNNLITDESVAISWSVSGNIGVITQSGAFTAVAAVGSGQVVASAANLQSVSNVTLVNGMPPGDFRLTETGEKIYPSRTFTISWITPEATSNRLVKYDIYGATVTAGGETNDSQWVYLKKDVDISKNSKDISVPYDGIYDIKVRVIDSQGLWRDSNGLSSGGDLCDASRILRAKVDAIPPTCFSLSNINANGTYLDNPKGPIIWNSAQDDNLDRYELSLCTDPNNVSGTTLFSRTIAGNTTSSEVSLPTGFYYVNVVAYDKAGHYRTLAGKTDLPAYDNYTLSSGWVYSLPLFGINGSALNFVTRWGSEGAGSAQFKGPYGIAVDRDGYVYVVDSGNSRIEKFDASGNFIASWGSFGSGNGQFLNTPRWIAVDSGPYQDVYIADTGGYVYIFHNDGSFFTRWQAVAAGESPGVLWGIAVDNSLNIFVTDVGNHNIKKFSYNGSLLSKWGSSGTGDGQFNFPVGIVVDAGGNVYVADSGLARIQKFDNSGTYISKWSTSLMTEANESSPRGIDIDNGGNIWVADGSVIKKFDGNGNLKLKWGHYDMDGPDDNLYFYAAQGIAVDGNGNIYLTEDQRHRVQKFRE